MHFSTYSFDPMATYRQQASMRIFACVLAGASAACIAWRHRLNVGRLIAGLIIGLVPVPLAPADAMLPETRRIFIEASPWYGWNQQTALFAFFAAAVGVGVLLSRPRSRTLAQQ